MKAGIVAFACLVAFAFAGVLLARRQNAHEEWDYWKSQNCELRRVGVIVPWGKLKCYYCKTDAKVGNGSTTGKDVAALAERIGLERLKEGVEVCE